MRGQRNSFSVFGALVGLAFTLHIVLASVVIINPGASRINPVLKFYRRFIVLGPFFQESRIALKSHLIVRQYVNGSWSSPADYACADVADARLIRYPAIQRRSFEVFLTERVETAKDKARVRALSELEMYLRSQDRFANADSIAIEGVRRGSLNKDANVEVVIVQHKFKR